MLMAMIQRNARLLSRNRWTKRSMSIAPTTEATVKKTIATEKKDSLSKQYLK